MPENDSLPPRRIRWWPGTVVLLLTIAVVLWVRAQESWPFQRRNLTIYQVAIVGVIALIIWWTFFSRAATRLRLVVTFGLLGVGVMAAILFRVSGVTGDLWPIIEFRWSRSLTPANSPAKFASTFQGLNPSTNSFPQFLGPNRDGVLSGPRLETNWSAHPPEVLWRQKAGAAWSGFAIEGELAVTQEQRGDDECVVAYDLMTGKQLWLHSDRARYRTTIAGEGPRATPTISSNRVFTLGATGILNCLTLANGKLIWSRDVVKESSGRIPVWGATSSPLTVNDLVVVHGGEEANRSLFAFRAGDGKLVWSGGAANPSYAAPAFATLAGTPQVLAFNDGSISAHDPATGATLWEIPWGNGNVVCSSPVVISSNQVLFSSGYGVGAELIEISHAASGKLSARPIWKSIRMKAKFAHLFPRTGFVYGLDDGVFACVDLRDGSQRWKEGRYGHGQGLVVGEDYLLLSESGELVLLRPTPDAPNELARFRVFDSKTWNPPSLAGDLLLVRNDQEAASLRLAIFP